MPSIARGAPTVPLIVLVLGLLWASLAGSLPAQEEAPRPPPAQLPPGEAERAPPDGDTASDRTVSDDAAAGVGRPVAIETVQGRRTGALRGLQLDAARQLLIDDESLPLVDVLRLELNETTSFRRELQVLLADGSVLHGGLGPGTTDTHLDFNGRLLPDGVRIPLEWVRLLVFQPQDLGDSNAAAQEAARAARELPSEGSEDRLLTTSGAQLQGLLATISGRGVSFEDRQLGKLELPWTQVRAVRVAALDPPPTIPAGALLVWAEGVDGARLRGTLTEFGAEHLALESPLLGTVRLEIARVAALEFQLGRVRYLSDLDPMRVVESGPEGTGEYWSFPWQRDRDVLDDTLLLGSGKRTFRKGLGVHAVCRLTYRVEPGDRSFQSWIGISNSVLSGGTPATEHGKCVFQVLVDGEKRFDSGVLSWNDTPRRVDVALEGARELELVMLDGSPLGFCILSRGAWGEARILRD